MKFITIPMIVVLLSTNLFLLAKADNSITIGAFDRSSFEVVDPAGTSTVTVDYNVDGATIGNNAQAGTDFYIKHELLAKDCEGMYTGSAPVTLATDADATTVSEKVTSTLTNTASWLPGTYEFCIQYTLYLLGPSTPFAWQVYGVNLQVDVVYPEGGSIGATAGAGLGSSVGPDAIGAQVTVRVGNGGSPVDSRPVPQVASPAVSSPVMLDSVAVSGDGNVEYGENFDITWQYLQNMEGHINYSVDTATILLIDADDDGEQQQVEYPEGTAITFRDMGGSVGYTETRNVFGTSSTGGKITASLPRKVFDAELTELKIKFTVRYDIKEDSSAMPPARRNLRPAEAEAHMTSGTFDEVITIQLVAPSASSPDEDNTSGIKNVGYYNIPVLSAICVVALCLAAGVAVLFALHSRRPQSEEDTEEQDIESAYPNKPVKKEETPEQ